MTHITGRLTAKNRDQLRNPTLGNRVWATLYLFYHTGRPHYNGNSEWRLAFYHISDLVRDACLVLPDVGRPVVVGVASAADGFAEAARALADAVAQSLQPRHAQPTHRDHAAHPPTAARSFSVSTYQHTATMTCFCAISMPAGFRRHLVGKTLINVSYCDIALMRFVNQLVA